MASDLQNLLDKLRQSSNTEKDKGTYFERLILQFLKQDPVYTQQFDGVWTYQEWAHGQGISEVDDGIDLVAKLRDEDGFCAIQCKFYKTDHSIQKSDIDSFFTASGKTAFKRRLIADTATADLGKNVIKACKGQQIPVNRIGINELEASPIDWSQYAKEEKIKLEPKKTPREHQVEAIGNVIEGLKTANRGKLIMACGTGKTYTSLKIAEKMAGKGKMVLYLVPSLALMAQTIREWSNDSEIPLHSFSVCSDTQVGKRKVSKNDPIGMTELDLAFPATTDAKLLAFKVQAGLSKAKIKDEMTVVFSTYQSIQVISQAQNKHKLPEFDLIVCDEAHRTTGVTLSDEDESNFVKVHDQKHIQGKKRIYMTATPRVYGESIKAKAKEADAELCSMNDPEKFGETLHEITFSEAVQKELLTDYKVIVLAVDEEMISASIQKRLANANSELNLDDATKIIGCYKALAKIGLKKDLRADDKPMQRAVAFCKDIKSSKLIVEEFYDVVKEYLDEQDIEPEEREGYLTCKLNHVDGTFNAKRRAELINWLNDVEQEDQCHILSNARCLSEGVDVPSLDAILFMHPRKSQVDVVQSVGRVMRRAEGKQLGYVILPIGIPASLEPEEALNNNDKYRVVWQILNALRSHDDRFEAGINKIDLGEPNSQIEIIGIGDGCAPGDDNDESGDSSPKPTPDNQMSLQYDEEFSKAILARIVKKCGSRDYWVDWAGDIANIAQTHITRIKGILKKDNTKERKAFDDFLAEIRDDLNESITEEDAIEMLAQHIITRPVFEALFDDYSFSKNNPVSQAMQGILDVLQEQNLEKESESLQKFYDSVHRRAEGLQTAEAKQQIVVQLYDKFFRNAFPRLTEKLGIVYTPVEVVDFIIHSVNDVLKKEFGQTLGSKGVHILDPFTGTGTFITRLLQSGLIKPEELQHKYEKEIHANEIVLLAYYIAAINIEQVYHELAGSDYKPFKGICLTDTFQLYEKDDLISNLMVDNSGRRKRQKKLDIRVIMGNPPYSTGQKSANDNAANVAYPSLDESIKLTYAKHSTATLKNALYDSYIRAIKWGTKRIGDSGVMAFVSGSAWIERAFADGMRKCLTEDWTSIYVFHLRGDVRKNMLSKGRAKEGENIFGSNSMTGITVCLFVKNSEKTNSNTIYYYDIGNNLSRKAKLKKIANLRSIRGITQNKDWHIIAPDKYNDWINQRDETFDHFIQISNHTNNGDLSIFKAHSPGIVTGRDIWCYNSSKSAVESNMTSHIDFYNSETKRIMGLNCINPIDNINLNPKKISWTRSLKRDLSKFKAHEYNPQNLKTSMYRPYFKQWFYFDKNFNESIGKTSRFFPENLIENRVIIISGKGSRSGFSVLMVSALPCYDTIEKCQCFPLKILNNKTSLTDGIFENDTNAVKDGINDAAFAQIQEAYPNEKLTKDDFFYYIYGLLHSEDYRARYADNLSKQLPRIPYMKKAEDFWKFSKAGRELAELHVNYESVEPYEVTFKDGMFMDDLEPTDYYVKKMKFGKKRVNNKNVPDKSTVIYNSKITMSDIPLEAYEYIVNGKPALEWVMERQCVKTDKASGIVNDANLYATETVGDPAYPLKLFQRVITVSLETMKIVKALPKLEIPEPEEVTT